MRALMIVTSTGQLGDTGQPTGLWLDELAIPYREFDAQHYSIDIASTLGGEAPIDPKSIQEASEDGIAFLADTNAIAKVRATESIRQLNEIGATYDVYFVVGGHGIMWDGPDNPDLQKMLAEAYEAERVVAAVCHGPAALVNVKLSNGEYLVKGRRVNSFTDEEERALELQDVVPFLLESKLRERGALFVKAPPGQECVAEDTRLVTGQNPASARGTANRITSILAPELTGTADTRSAT